MYKQHLLNEKSFFLPLIVIVLTKSRAASKAQQISDVTKDANASSLLDCFRFVLRHFEEYVNYMTEATIVEGGNRSVPRASPRINGYHE